MFSTSGIFTSTKRTLNLIAGDFGAKVVGFDIYAPDNNSGWEPSFTVKRLTDFTGGDFVGAPPMFLDAERAPTSIVKLGGSGDSYFPGSGDFTGCFDLVTDSDRPMTFSYRCRDGIPVTLDPENFFQLFVGDTYGSQDVIATIYWVENPINSYYVETEFTSTIKILKLIGGAAGATITGFDIVAPYTSNASKPRIRASRFANWNDSEIGDNVGTVSLNDGGVLPSSTRARLFGSDAGGGIIGWWYGVSLDPASFSTYKVRFDRDKRIHINYYDYFQLYFDANYIDDVVVRIYFTEPSV
jgi:hypothetical protein